MQPIEVTQYSYSASPTRCAFEIISRVLPSQDPAQLPLEFSYRFSEGFLRVSDSSFFPKWSLYLVYAFIGFFWLVLIVDIFKGRATFTFSLVTIIFSAGFYLLFILMPKLLVSPLIDQENKSISEQINCLGPTSTYNFKIDRNEVMITGRIPEAKTEKIPTKAFTKIQISNKPIMETNEHNRKSGIMSYKTSETLFSINLINSNPELSLSVYNWVRPKGILSNLSGKSSSETEAFISWAKSLASQLDLPFESTINN